jgi:hypothetical protein
MPKEARKLIKMSVNITPELLDALKNLARKRGTSVTSVLWAAIKTEIYLDGVIAKGDIVLIKDKRGKMQRLVFL